MLDDRCSMSSSKTQNQTPQNPPHPLPAHPRPKTTTHPPLRTTQRPRRHPSRPRKTRHPNQLRHPQPPLLTWQIAQDNDTREDLEAAHNASIEELTEKQLQLRLLEQSSRPNMDHTQLRAITQSFARLQSVKLS